MGSLRFLAGFYLLFCLAAPAHAEQGSTGGKDRAEDLSNQINDPTSPLTTLQLRDVVTPRVPDANGPGNALELLPVVPILPSHFLPFTQLLKATLLVLVTLPSPTSVTGLGDFQLFDLVTISQSWGRWGFGPIFVFPTATSQSLGQGKWQVGPALGGIYSSVKNLVIGAVLQNPISFAGDASRPSVNSLVITPTATYTLPGHGGWFLGYSDFNLSFDWENGGAATIPVGIQAGKVLELAGLGFSASLEGGAAVVRPSSFPRWLIGIELTAIHPDRK